MKIFTPIQTNKMTAANRIMLPPIVMFGVDTKDGAVGDYRMNFYEQRARDGVGTIVVEAVAIAKDYIITPKQIGAWDDSFIPELSELAERIKKHGSIAVVQLQHAGGKPYAEINPNPFGPSTMEYVGHNMREATIAELENAVEEFILAALRMKKAGFDGIEIHNAHGYLLTQMVNPLLNKRTDEYGGDIRGRMKLSLDVLHGIRKACGNDFIIGVRFGANEPSYDDGVAIAKIYAENGIDYLSASHGYLYPDNEEFNVPKDFPYNAIVYGGVKIKEAMKKENYNVPVILVNHIETVARGEWLLQMDLGDMIAYAKPLIATPDFVSRGKAAPDIPNNNCLYCKNCIWVRDANKCTGLLTH